MLRSKVTGDANINAGATAVIIRRFHIQLDDSLEPKYMHGYRIWTITNYTGNVTQVNVTASNEEPAYMFSFTDASLNFNNCCYLTDKFNEPKYYVGGCGGTGTGIRHESWEFFPDNVFDFSPLFAKVDARLDNQ